MFEEFLEGGFVVRIVAFEDPRQEGRGQPGQT
jgi:hypothetical protein